MEVMDAAENQRIIKVHCSDCLEVGRGSGA